MAKSSSAFMGVRIRTLNLFMLILSGLLFALAFYITIQVTVRYTSLVKVTDDYINYQEKARIIRAGSDYLTQQVRLYAQTLEPSYAENFFREVFVTRSRELALSSFPRERASTENYAYLEETVYQSNELVKREFYAMKLISLARNYRLESIHPSLQEVKLSQEDLALPEREKIERARAMVFGNEYQDHKRTIMDNLDRFTDNIIRETRTRQLDDMQRLGDVLVQQRMVLGLLFLISVLTFAIIRQLIVKPLQIYMKCIKEERTLELMGAYEFRHLALTYNNIYEIKAANDAMLRHKAEHDQLTGLLNRRGFEGIRQMLRLRIKPVAVLLVDVDHFKEVNDTRGHAVGDAVLQHVANLLRHSFRANDYCIRFGGDEFTVIMLDATPGMKPLIREKVLSINQTLQNPETEYMPPVSLSVGVAFAAESFPDNIFQEADRALYNVKEHGRCGCSFADELSPAPAANDCQDGACEPAMDDESPKNRDEAPGRNAEKAPS